MDSKSFQRKHIVPKLHLTELSNQTHALTSRETSALINSAREVKCNRAATFETNRYNSKRPDLWSSFTSSRKTKIYEVHQSSEEELSQQVCDLTFKLDNIRSELSLGNITFREAGKLLSTIRNEYKSETITNNNDDDLIFCLDLVEKLWECINDDGLSCSEFSNLLSNLLNKPQTEFEILFQKMDADGDETLSWNEYVSFLSQQQSHLWDQQENKDVSYFKENFSNVYNFNNINNHMFNKICIINGDKTTKCTLNSHKYALLTSDNSIEIRNAINLSLESIIDCDKSITNLNCINDGILAVSFMDRSIKMYSPTKTDRNKKYKIYYDLQHTFFALDIPMCMEIFNINNNTMLIGETYGTIGLYNYLNHNCLVRIKCHDNKTSEPCVVKQVKNVPRIGIVSAGMDSNIIVTDSVKWSTIRRLSGHTRGVYSIAYSLSNKILISVGYDNKICLWDPYVTKPLGLLKGHMNKQIVDVLINEQSKQIITASIDKKIKIWDVRTWKCLQTIRDTSIHLPINELSSIKYDPLCSCLITAGSKLRKWHIQNLNNSNKIAAIIDIVYSNIFKQIISIHVDETCILWNMYNGQNSFNFKMNEKITTIGIDKIGKRLLTASQNGIIKMWNFNNGAVMHQFDKLNFEITKLIYLPRTLHCVVASGYNSIIHRLPSHLAPIEANFIIQNKLHKTDVKTMCISHPQNEYLLTGSSDGIIIEWHIDSNVKSQIFYCQKPHISICEMTVYKNFLFVGNEEGSIQIFYKHKSNGQNGYKYMTSITDKYIFNEPILKIVINENGTRLMIADCDITMKLFDISNLTPNNKDFILIKQWTPHINGCITSLLYINSPFDVFCSSSDNGQLILWNNDGIFLGQFGQDIEWNLFGIHNNNNNNNNNNKKFEDKNNNILEEIEKDVSSPLKKRKSYFDDHSVYRPKFIKSVVTESIARTLLESETHTNKIIDNNNKSDKTKFEQNLDKLMTELINPKKRKKSCMKPRASRRSTLAPNIKPRASRRSTIASNIKPGTQRSKSRLKT